MINHEHNGGGKHSNNLKIKRKIYTINSTLTFTLQDRENSEFILVDGVLVRKLDYKTFLTVENDNTVEVFKVMLQCQR